MYNSFWRIAAVNLVLLFVIVSLCSCGHGPIAFTVNGLDVEKAELVYYMRENASVVAAELEDTKGLDSSREDFWTAPQNGVDAFEVLKDTTIRQIVRVKVEQMCAKEYGIDTPLYYSEQLRKLEKYNSQRKKAENEGKILYGPVERDFVAYFREWYLDMKNQLMKKLQKDEKIAVSTEEIEKYYYDYGNELAGSKDEKMSNIKDKLLQDVYEKYIDGLVEQAVIGEEKAEILPEDVI